jgi:hypothetical protein
MTPELLVYADDITSLCGNVNIVRGNAEVLP